MFLCHDRVGNGGEALCINRIFYVVTEYGQMERFYVVTRISCHDRAWSWEEVPMSRLDIQGYD